MNDQHWNDLLAALRGEQSKPLPIGFIIDCPWLPNWYGVNILDYFQSDEVWFEANKKAIETFPGMHVPARLLVGVRDVHRTVGASAANASSPKTSFPSPRR